MSKQKYYYLISRINIITKTTKFCIKDRIKVKVDNLEEYRNKIKEEHSAQNVYFHYEEIPLTDQIKLTIKYCK